MKTSLLGSIALVLAFGSGSAGAGDTSPAAQSVVTLHSVEFRGKPPFRRSRETLPVTDIAELSAVQQPPMERVTTTDFSGRPPFARRVEKLQVVDVARLETVDSSMSEARPRSRFAGRTAGPRFQP